MLRAYARKLLRGREADADDFAQDAIRRYLEKFGDQGQEPPRDPAAWLMRTLMNLLLSDWRKRAVRSRAYGDPVFRLVGYQPVEALDADEAPASTFEGVSFEDLEAAVNRLTPKLKDAYILHAAGCGNGEIAQRLGVPLGTVGKRLWDARKKLREHLEPPGRYES